MVHGHAARVGPQPQFCTELDVAESRVPSILVGLQQKPVCPHAGFEPFEQPDTRGDRRPERMLTEGGRTDQDRIAMAFRLRLPS